MKSLIYPLIFLVSLSLFSQEIEEEFTPIVIGDKEAFLSSKTGEYVYRSHADTDPMSLKTTESGVIYREIKIHKVKTGETLYVIAKKRGLSVSELKSQNKLKDNNLKVGQELQIVKLHKVKSSSPVINQAEGRIIARLAPGQTPNGMTPPDLPPDAMPGSTINLVVEKDAKESIAKQEKVTNMEGIVSETKEKTEENGSITHTVKKGESLFSIAKKYKISIKDLKEDNRLALNTLSVGQKLKVKVYNPEVLNPTQPIKLDETEPIPVEVESTDTTKVKEKPSTISSTLTPLNKGSLEKAQTITKPHDQKEKVIIGLIEKYTNKNDVDTSSDVEKSSNVKMHVVKKGETLWEISRKYKMSIAELIELNNLKSNNLSIGQKLVIK